MKAGLNYWFRMLALSTALVKMEPSDLRALISLLSNFSVSVHHSARSGGKIGISVRFSLT